MDEAYIEMRCYVKFALHFGFSEDLIKKELIKTGWPLDKINRAIMEVKGIKPMQKPAPQKAQNLPAVQLPPVLVPPEAPPEEAPAPQ